MKVFTKPDIKTWTRFWAIGVLAYGPIIGSAQAEENYPLIQTEAPSTEKLAQLPKNLARWHMGSVLFYERDDYLVAHNWRDAYKKGSPSALLSDDPTIDYPLTMDSHKFVVDFGKYQQISKFSFRNNAAAGRVQLFYGDALQSPQSPRWRKASKLTSFTSEDSSLKIDIELLDARYVLAIFDVTKSGSISSLGIHGKPSLLESRYSEAGSDESDSDSPSASEEAASTDFNFATVHSGAEVTHVNSGTGEATVNMIDDDLETSYLFDQEEESIFVVNLSNTREIKRVSMVFESGPGKMDFYFTNNLPDSMFEATTEMAHIWNNGSLEPLLLASTGGLTERMLIAQASSSGVQKVSLPASFFEDRTPSFNRTIEENEKSFRVEFDKTSGRFLVVRWQPNPTNTSQSGLRVFEIGLFGEVKEPNRLLKQIPLFEFFEDLPPAQQNAGGLGTASDALQLNPIELPNPISPLGLPVQ